METMLILGIHILKIDNKKMFFETVDVCSLEHLSAPTLKLYVLLFCRRLSLLCCLYMAGREGICFCFVAQVHFQPFTLQGSHTEVGHAWHLKERLIITALCPGFC